MMNRRQFLGMAGVGGLSLACSPLPKLDPRTTPSALAAATSADGFDTPLLVPRPGAGLLGVFEGGAPLSVKATTQAVSVFPGITQDFLVYKVQRGQEMSVNPLLLFRSGQPLQAALENQLNQGTIIHWHGLVVDPRNDGLPQETIQPGSSYTYDFTIKNRGGTYWYHPHPDGFTSSQAYLGMASFFIVEDDDDARLRNAVGLALGVNEIPIVIQDKRLDAQGKIVYQPTDQDWFMGYLGDTILANLTPKPVLDVDPGPVRLRLLNGSNARIYLLALVDATAGGQQLPFVIIGNDGGLLPSASSATQAFLAPGERLDVLVDLSARAGHTLFMKSLAFDPLDNETTGGGMGGGTSATGTLANGDEFYVLKIAVRNATGRGLAVPSQLSVVRATDIRNAYARRIRLSQMMGAWTINGQQYNPTAFPITAGRRVEIWQILNDMMSMPHPMHIHGFQFQVLSRSGSPTQVKRLAGSAGLLPSDHGWKDTVLTWPGETVSVAIDFRQALAGEQRYVFHCHNLEHEERGMMVNYRVL